MKIQFVLLSFLLTGVVWGQTSSKLALYGSLAGRAGVGTAKDSKEEIVESRNLFNYGAEASLGVRLGGIVVGGTADYLMWQQRDDAKDVGNTDVSGTQLILSPNFGYALRDFLLQAKIPMYSKFTLREEDANGNKVVYTDAKLPTVIVQLKYGLSGKTFIGLEFSQTTYKKMEIAGNDTKLDSDSEVTFSSWGLMYGILF